MQTAPGSENWQLAYNLPWYLWAAGALYSLVVESFMSLVLLGGCLVAIGSAAGSLLGVLPKSLGADLNHQPWYMLLLAVAFGGALGVLALRQVATELLDLLTPGRVHRGRLDQLENQRIQGLKGSYHRWALTVDGQLWIIDPPLFSGLPALRLTPGQPVRVHYRRGSRTVTQVWRQL